VVPVVVVVTPQVLEREPLGKVTAVVELVTLLTVAVVAVELVLLEEA
jgi:hypothetical protein